MLLSKKRGLQCQLEHYAMVKCFPTSTVTTSNGVIGTLSHFHLGMKLTLSKGLCHSGYPSKSSQWEYEPDCGVRRAQVGHIVFRFHSAYLSLALVTKPRFGLLSRTNALIPSIFRNQQSPGMSSLYRRHSNGRRKVRPASRIWYSLRNRQGPEMNPLSWWQRGRQWKSQLVYLIPHSCQQFLSKKYL